MQVVDISSAPSVGLQATENAESIAEVRAQANRTDRRVDWLFGQMRDASAEAGVHLPDHDATSPLPKLALLPQDGERRNGGQAGLCPVAGAPLVLGSA